MWGLSTLLVTCHVVIQVSAVLLPPRNLKIFSKNFKHILTWEDPNKVSPIYYCVIYSDMYYTFQKTKYCANVTTRRCDLTEDLTNITHYYKMKVFSFIDDNFSDHSTAVSLTPVMETVLGPPIVDIAACDRCIQVFVQPPVSNLWSEEKQQVVSMNSEMVFPDLDCNITVMHMTEVKTLQIDLNEENKIISNLLPNTNYCVSVTVSARVNFKTPILSELKCVVTEDHAHGSGTVYIIVSVVCGILLLIGLVICLSVLDISGYICRARSFIPKVLKSMPTSETAFIDVSEFTSPTFSISVDISETLEEKQKQESEDKYCEGGYANRKRLLDSDISGTTTSGDLPSAVSSSIGSSGPANCSAEEDLSVGHLGDRGSSIAHLPVSATDDSSNRPFDTSGIFNINLNTVSIADRAEVWTGFKQVDVPQEEAEGSIKSHEAGIVLDQYNDICLGVDGLEEEFCSDYEEEEDISENNDSDNHLISGYMRR